MPEKWERQEYETKLQYDLFATYRDLGITRSMKKVAQVLGRHERFVGRLMNLSPQNHWVERVTAYDEWMENERRTANIDAIRKMNEEGAMIARQLRKLPMVRIKAIQDKLKAAMEIQDPEDRAAALEEAVSSVPLHLMAQWLELSFALEREALGVAEKIDVNVKHDEKSLELARDDLMRFLDDRRARAKDNGPDGQGSSSASQG